MVGRTNAGGSGSGGKATVNVYNAAKLGGQTTVYFTNTSGKVISVTTDSNSYTSVSLPLGSYTVTSADNSGESVSVNLTTKGGTYTARFPLYLIYNGSVNTRVLGGMLPSGSNVPYQSGSWLRKDGTDSYMYSSTAINLSAYNRLYYSYAGCSTSVNNPVGFGMCSSITGTQTSFSYLAQITATSGSNQATFDISSDSSSKYLIGSTYSGTASSVYAAFGTVKLFNV